MTIEQVMQQEEQLQFEVFNHETALDITNEIVEYVKQHYPKPVGIQIFYNEKMVLHYLMDGRKNSPWLERKTRTVMESGHSSLWAFYKNESEERYKHWETDERYAICGGGFPVIEKGVIKGAICVSGLDHMDDHDIIIQVLKKRLLSKK